MDDPEPEARAAVLERVSQGLKAPARPKVPDLVTKAQRDMQSAVAKPPTRLVRNLGTARLALASRSLLAPPHSGKGSSC